MHLIEQCDEAAANVARAYMTLGRPAFVLYVTESGDVRTIGPDLHPETVARMLRSAADAYLANAKNHTVN